MAEAPEEATAVVVMEAAKEEAVVTVEAMAAAVTEATMSREEATIEAIMAGTEGMVEDIMAVGITAADTMAGGIIGVEAPIILGSTGDQARIGIGVGPITIHLQIIIILLPRQSILIRHRVNRHRVKLAKLRQGGTNSSFIPAKARAKRNRIKTAKNARLGQRSRLGLTQPSHHQRGYLRPS
jgi:nucleoid DNA-binding protein